MVIDGIEVFQLFDIVSSAKPLSRPWLLETEELEGIVRSWCDREQADYYSAAPDTFSMSDAIEQARSNGKSRVVVAELAGDI